MFSGGDAAGAIRYETKIVICSSVLMYQEKQVDDNCKVYRRKSTNDNIAADLERYIIECFTAVCLIRNITMYLLLCTT